MINRFIISVGLLLGSLFHLPCLNLSTISCALAQTSPNELLRRSDEIRLPTKDYTMLARVTSSKPGSKDKIGIYEVMSKGKTKSIIKTLAPPMDKDRLLLMRDDNFWAYLPNISKPLRISLRDRLLGEVANADIARANFHGDYQATLLSIEIIEKAEYSVLELKAKDNDVAYARVKLWVESATAKPLKAEFYGVSGRILKSCTFERYALLGGRSRPTRIVMSDPLVKGQKSIIEYAKMEPKPLSDKFFTDEYMKRLAAR